MHGSLRYTPMLGKAFSTSVPGAAGGEALKTPTIYLPIAIYEQSLGKEYRLCRHNRLLCEKVRHLLSCPAD
jgi:hypothetical protein